jgi:hypothetical protein
MSRSASLYGAAGLLAATTALASVASADACACGALVRPDPRAALPVVQETSVVRWRAGREEITMRLTIAPGASARRAAWILPVPAPARVALGSQRLFTDIDALISPRRVQKTEVRLFPGGGGAAAPGGGPETAGAPRVGGVDVLGRSTLRTRLGPLETVLVRGTSAEPLARWLRAHGFGLAPRLETALGAYTSRHWLFVAARLEPSADRPLGGEIEPLVVSFASPEIVYPMRLARLADGAEGLRLHVIAPWKVHLADAGGVSPTDPRSDLGHPQDHEWFAGRIAPGSLDEEAESHGGTRPGSPLEPLFAGEPGGMYLTSFQGVATPDQINGDVRFARTAGARAFRIATVTIKPLYVLPIALAAGAALLVVGFAVIAVVAALSWRRSRRAAGQA